jgi:hypothetical protein
VPGERLRPVDGALLQFDVLTPVHRGWGEGVAVESAMTAHPLHTGRGLPYRTVHGELAIGRASS